MVPFSIIFVGEFCVTIYTRVYSSLEECVRNLEIPSVLSWNEHEFHLDAGLKVCNM